MVRRRLIWRIFRLIVISCCVLLVATFVTVQVGQRILRHRAEQLKLDLLHLQVGKSSLSEMQVLMARRGKYGRYVGSCTAQECDYHVNLSEWLGDSELNIHNSPSPWRFLAVPMVLTAPIVHWQMGSVDAEITLKDGRVTSWRFHVMTQVAKGYGPGWRFGGPAPDGYTPYTGGEYALIAEIRAQANVQQDYLWPFTNPHPNYVVREPSSCMICIAIWTELGPSATSGEIYKLSSIQLDCLTRWSPCTQESDIYPEAWNVYLRDGAFRRDMYQRLEECRLSLEEMAGGSDSIIKLRILGESIKSDAGPGTTAISAEMLNIVMGSIALRPRQKLQFFEESPRQRKEWNFHPGDEAFMFNADVTEGHPSGVTTLYRPYCATIPASPENTKKLNEIMEH